MSVRYITIYDLHDARLFWEVRRRSQGYGSHDVTINLPEGRELLQLVKRIIVDLLPRHERKKEIAERIEHLSEECNILTKDDPKIALIQIELEAIDRWIKEYKNPYRQSVEELRLAQHWLKEYYRLTCLQTQAEYLLGAEAAHD